MSIKLYYLYKVDSPKVVKQGVADLADDYYDSVEQEMCRFASDVCSSSELLLMDKMSYAGISQEAQDSSGISDSFVEDHKKMYTMKLMLMEHDGQHYVYFATGSHADEITDFICKFVQDYGLKDFSYWDNTDKPDNISEQEWSQRLKVIEALAPDNYFVGEEINLSIPDRELTYYIQFVPNKHSRCACVALSVLPYMGVSEDNQSVDFSYCTKIHDFVYGCDFSQWYGKLHDVTIPQLVGAVSQNNYSATSDLTSDDIEEMKNYVIALGKDSGNTLFHHEAYSGIVE